MHSHIVTVYDRSRHDPKARVLRNFELVGQSAGCAWRAAAEAASTMPEARDYYVSKG
ncbi:hypothetical protein [Reyranella sp.]|uniref:hypothetical protein n=1 Tax=Reyranella sp. TaxID=1929291 RepID=UPI0025DF5207|nr:hypothetical protein [Reyranella sp.]